MARSSDVGTGEALRPVCCELRNLPTVEQLLVPLADLEALFARPIATIIGLRPAGCEVLGDG